MGRNLYRVWIPKGLGMNEYPKVSVLNALTGEVTERDMTPEEIAALPEPGEPLTPTEPE